MRPLFIVNPAAGHGRAMRRWVQARTLAAATCPDHAAWTTSGPGDGAALARRGLAEGFTALVAVGGDGTLGEVVDGVLSAPEDLRQGAVVGMWPAGSGCDVARHLGVRPDPEQFAALLACPTRRRLDAGRVTYRDADGCLRQRHFVNIAAFGLAGEVARAVRRRGKALGGTLTYLVESLRTVAQARARPVTLVVDGIPEPAAPYHLGVVANTSTFGGGMRVAPAADPTDGWLELVTVGALSRAALLRLLPRAYTGGHVGRPGVTVRRVRRVEASGAGPWPLNIDGDVCGSLPAVIEVLPGALSVLVPA